ncbi:cupin domain-containing protein [Petrimonas sp.]|uniref:cupin domain-containing protein n=1 Tax=Petrimonas sp. TaxID=2023866 RepID=UPI003F51878D
MNIRFLLFIVSIFFMLPINAQNIQPETFFFKDDGVIPNNKLPLLLYRNAFTDTGNTAAEWLEKTFRKNNWSNGWRWGVYPFHHYHSNTAEVLGVFSGTAKLLLGGEKGKVFDVKPGDIIIIPPGVGHKCLSHSNDFTVVGAYPDGKYPDLFRGEKSDRPKVDENIATVPVPETDPLLGAGKGLVNIWK